MAGITTSESMAGEQPDQVMIPVFKCNRVAWEDGIDRFCFVCPKCAKTNVHSANGPDSDGHRVSHCKCWGVDGYYLEESPVTCRVH